MDDFQTQNDLRRREARSRVLSDPKYKNNPALLQETLIGLDDAFNVDFSSIENNPLLDDKTRELALGLYLQQKETAQNEYLNEYQDRLIDHKVRSDVFGGILANDLEGLTDKEKAQRILSMDKDRADIETISKDGFIETDPRLNSWGESFASFFPTAGGTIEKAYGGTVSALSNVADMGSRALANQPKYSSEEFYSLLQEAENAGDQERYNSLMEEQTASIQNYADEMIKDPTVARLSNLTNETANAVTDLFGLSDTKEREAISFNSAKDSIVRDMTNKLIISAREGNGLYLNPDGTINRGLINQVANEYATDLTHKKDKDGNLVPMPVGEIVDVDFVTKYNSKFNELNSDRLGRLITDTEYFNQDGMLQSIREHGNRVIDRGNLRLERVNKVRENSVTQQRLKASLAQTDEAFKNSGLLNALGLEENEFLRDAYKAVAFPLMNPTDTILNQAMQAPEFIAQVNPLTLVGTAVAEGQNTERMIKEAIAKGELPKDMTKEELAQRIATGDLGGAVGLFADRLLMKTMRDTGSALSKAPDILKGNTIKGGTSVGRHVLEKYGSVQANIAEATLAEQATGLNRNKELSDVDRNRTIADSVTPSATVRGVKTTASVAKAVGYTAPKAIYTKAKGKASDVANDQWTKIVSKYNQGKEYLKDSVPDMASFRKNMDTANDKEETATTSDKSDTISVLQEDVTKFEQAIKDDADAVDMTLKEYNEKNGTNLTRSEFGALKKESKSFREATTNLVDNAKSAIDSAKKTIKDSYKELSKNKDAKPEDITDMSDDILKNFESLDMSVEELNTLANSPAVQNNPVAKENFDFIKTLYGVDETTQDKGTGFVAPMSPSFEPTTRAEKSSKEFFYGGGNNPNSMGIMNYIDKIRTARKNDDPSQIRNLLGYAKKWLDNQTKRVDNGKLYGKVLERAKYEQSLIERVVRYGEGHLAKLNEQENSEPTTPIENLNTKQPEITPTEAKQVDKTLPTNDTVAPKQPTVEQKSDGSLSSMLQQSLRQEKEKSEAQKAVDKIIPEDTVETLNELESTKEATNKTVVSSVVKNYQEGKLNDDDVRVIEESFNNTHDEAELTKVTEKIITANSKEASETISNNKDAEDNASVNKLEAKPIEDNIVPERISTEDITNDIEATFHEVGNDPNTLLQIANTTNLDTRDLPYIAMSASETRSTNDPRFKALKNFGIGLSILSNSFVRDLVGVSDRMNKIIDNIQNLYDLLPELNDKDKARAEQLINDNYMALAKLNLAMTKIEGIRDISGFVREVTKGLFERNRDELRTMEVIQDASPIKFKSNSKTKGNPFKESTSISELAKADAKPETKVFSTPKGMFNFAISKAGEIFANTGWLYNKSSFVKEGVRRLREATRNITEEKDNSFTEAISELHDIIVSDIGNEMLDPYGSSLLNRDSRYYRKGESASFRQSPLTAVLYSTKNADGKGHNTFSDNMKASILVTALQAVKENAELIFRDRYSVSALLGRHDTSDVTGAEFHNFKDIGIPSTAFVERIQDSFQSMFSLDLDNSKIPSGLRERMASEAAILAVNYLVDTGVLVETKYTKDELNALVDDGNHFVEDVSFVKANYESIDGERIFSPRYENRMSPFRNFYDLGHVITGNDSSRKNAQPVSVSAKKVPVNLQTDTYTKRVLDGTQKHANETTYHVTPFYAQLVTNLEDMKELLGYNIPVESQVKQEIMLDGSKAGREGEISTLEGNVTALQNNPDLVSEGFKQPMSIYSNGRTAITSNVLNMMTDKVSRAFLHLGSFKKTRDKAFFETKSNALAMYMYGLAFKMGNTENAKREDFTNALETIETMDIPDNVKEIVERMRENGATLEDFKVLNTFGKNLFTETDNALGVINAVYELVNYRAVKAGEIDSFTSYMTVDNDAKNSGVAITRAVYGEQNFINKTFDALNLSQVGIYINEKINSFGEFSQKSGNFDAYQFVIKKGMDSLDEFPNNISRDIKNAMDTLAVALGEELYSDSKVHPILREIAKPLLMTAYYEAGTKSLKRSAVNAVMENIVKRMNSIATDQNVTRQAEDLANFNKAFGVSFTVESITNGLDNRGMARFYNNAIKKVAEPIAEMSVMGVEKLTESTSENRAGIIESLNDFSNNLQSLYNDSMNRLNSDGKFVSQKDMNTLNNFIAQSTMRVATTSGDYSEASYGLNLANYERSAVADLVGKSSDPRLRGVDYKSLSKAQKQKYDEQNEAYRRSESDRYKQDFLVNSNDRVTLPKFKSLGSLGVGALAKKAHAEDSGIVNDVYLQAKNPVLAIYDQFTTSPEDTVEVANIANESFKERTLNNSTTEDFAKSSARAIDNAIKAYMNDPEIQKIIPPEVFRNYIVSQKSQMNKLNAISNTVDNRRSAMFGSDRRIVVDNYPLGFIDDSVVSSSDNQSVTLFDKVSKLEVIQEATETMMSFAEAHFPKDVSFFKVDLETIARSKEIAKKQSKNYESVLKSMQNIITDKLQDWAKTVQGFVATEDSMSKTLGSLAKLDGSRLDKNTLQLYSSTLTQLIAPILDSAGELNPTRKQSTIKINEDMNNQEAFGYYSSKENETVVSLTANQSSEFSNSEVFVHELVHNATYDAIHKDKQLREHLFSIFNKAKEVAIKEGWNEAGHENNQMYEYVFNNPNMTKNGQPVPVGLLEFVSYGLSNPRMMDLLNQTESDYVNYRQPFQLTTGTGLFSRIINSVANSIANIVRPDYVNTKSDGYTALFETVKNIDRTNKQVLENIQLSETEGIVSFRDAVASINTVFDNFSEKTITEVKNKVAKINEKDPTASTAVRVILDLKGLKPDQRKALLDDLDQNPTEGGRIIDEAFYISKRTWLGNNQGELQTAKTSLMGGYNKAAKVKNLILKGIQKGTSDADLAKSTIRDRLAMFKSNITDIENSALTAGLINTEMVRLIDTIGANAMSNFIRASGIEKQYEISKLKKHLEANLPQEQAVSIMNQLNGLANYMSGRGELAPAQQQNTNNIIKGDYAPKDKAEFFERNSETLIGLRDAMDTYVAMRAYYDSNSEVRTNVENVFNKHTNLNGEPSDILIDALRTAREVRKTSIEKDFGGNETMASYGYSATMGDPNVMDHYVPQSEVSKYLKEGWKVVAENKSMSAVANEPIIMLQKRIPPELGYNDHALYSKHQRNPLGESISVLKRLEGENTTPLTRRQQEQDFNLQRELAWNAHMGVNKYNTVPIVNARGEYTGWTSNSNKNNLPLALQNDRMFTEVLADEYSRVAGDYTSKNTSVELIHALKEDFDENMSKDPNGFTYISSKAILDDGSRNPYYEAYQNLTPEVKYEIANTFGSEGFYVRQGMARAIIGTKKIDIATPIDNFLMKDNKASSIFGTNELTTKLDSMLSTKESKRDYIRTGDAVWRELVQRSKSAIAVMNPAVFMMNYASNATMLMINGITPAQIYKYTVESFKELKKYEASKKELSRVEMELLSKPNDRTLLAKQALIQSQLDSSLTQKMMDEGMMQSITTDIRYEEYGYLNRGGNYLVDKLNNLDKDKNLGDRSSKIFKEVFMVGDSTTGTLMSYMNQTMDYTSRYVYLKAKLANQKDIKSFRHDSEDKLVREAQDLFINYALPDSRGIEFANDMGILWFTKYYMGIQHVIMNTMRTKPVNSLAYLLGVSQIYQADDVFQNFFAVDAPSKLFRTPLDAIETLSVPPLMKAFF